jgi:acetyl esterase/lipase
LRSGTEQKAERKNWCGDFGDAPILYRKSPACVSRYAQQEQIAVPMKNQLPEVLPPTYLETAEFDCLYDEGILYAEKIKNHTAELQINKTKETFHGYDMLSNHPISKDSLAKRIAFMKKWMEKL